MTRVLVVGDVHHQRGRLDATLEMLSGVTLDLALLVGDVGRDPPWSEVGRRDQRAAHDDSVREVLCAVRDRAGCPVLFVPGNHDLPQPPDDTAGINCDRRSIDVAGLRVAGLGGAGPSRFGFAYEWSEDQAAVALRDTLAGQEGEIDILLCHTPPWDTALDRTHDGLHVGSRVVGTWIRRNRPRLFVCGHIHEAWGLARIDGIPCINAGALGEPFGQEIAWVVSWRDERPRSIESWRRDSDSQVERRLWHDGGQRPAASEPVAPDGPGLRVVDPPPQG